MGRWPDCITAWEGTVLQDHKVYCDKSVLQYWSAGDWTVLQYSWLTCIVRRLGLCRDTARARRLGSQVGTGERSRRAGRATDVGTARGLAGCAGSRRSGHMRQAQAGRARQDAATCGVRAGSTGARQVRRARAGWPGLCTWCTRPVFDPV